MFGAHLTPPSHGFTVDDFLDHEHRRFWSIALQEIYRGLPGVETITADDEVHALYYGLGAHLAPESLLQIGVRDGAALVSLCCGAKLRERIFAVEMAGAPGKLATAKEAFGRLKLSGQLWREESFQVTLPGPANRSSFDLIHLRPEPGCTAPELAAVLPRLAGFTGRILLEDAFAEDTWDVVKAFVGRQLRAVALTWFRSPRGLVLIEY